MAKAQGEAKVSDFGNGCYAWVQPTGGWGYANAGLVTSDGEALLIDTLFDAPFTRAMLDGFARVSDAKIKTVFNTHQNGDHWFGNALVPDAEIVATEKAADAMAHELPSRLAQLMKAAPNLGVTGEFFVHCFGQYDFAGAVPKLPDLTFNGHFAKQVGSKRVEMIDYANWVDPERIAVNVTTLYREFGDDSVPSDVVTLFGWMAQLWKDRR